MARRTYLEMTEPGALRKAPVPPGDLAIRLEAPCPAPLYRSLYLGVGEAYRWTDRAAWTDEEIEAHLRSGRSEVWTLRVDGAIAGYFELKLCEDGSVEVAYFGLLPAFVGRGLGGHLCSEAVQRAWAHAPTRVWLHTCTFDHPAALGNYIKRGFKVTRVEDYDAT